MCDASSTCSLLLLRVLFISHSCLLRLLLLLGTEFVELAEAVAVDDLGETAVGVVADEGLGTEEPVDAQQVLGCVVGVCFAECADVVVGLGAEGGSEFLTCLLHGDGLVVAQALQFIQNAGDEGTRK